MLRALALTCLLLLCSTSVWGLTVGYLPGAGELESAFNMLAYEGVGKAEKDFGLQVRARQGLEGLADEDEAARQVASLLQQSVDVIVAVGVEWAASIEKAAKENPDLRFIIVDAEVRDLPNVVSVIFANEEGGFLAGCLAGYMSVSKRVGFIGGVAIPPVRAFRHGYAQGLAYADPEVSMMTRYISQGPDFSGFQDQDTAYTLAEELYVQGVDIIFAVAGFAGLAVLTEAKEQDRYAIGVDYDQDDVAEGHVLTSVIKRADRAVYQELQRIHEDVFQPGVHLYDLRDGGIALSEMKYTRDKIPQVVQEKLLEVEEKIKHGVIEIEKLPFSPTHE